MNGRHLQVWALCCGAASLVACYSFIGRYAQPDLIEIAAMSGGVEHYLDDLDHRALVADEVEVASDDALDVRPRPGDPLRRADAAAGEVLLRFGLLSDVHIREPAVKLFNDRESRNLDRVINSFERHPVQEAFQPAVYLAYLKAFNALKQDPARRPRFLLHTGDGVDAGTILEMYQFIYLSLKADYPFLNVVGNHDGTIFGNYHKRLGYTKAAGPAFYPIGDLRTFLAMHSPGPRQIQDLHDQLLPLPSRSNDGESARRDLDAPGCPAGAVVAPVRPGRGVSRCLGFDLPRPVSVPGQAVLDKEVRCEVYPGYYAYTLRTCGKDTVQVIVLDSSRKERWGAGAEMDGAQLAWLAQRLREPATVRLVALHHPSHERELRPLAALLRQAGRAGSVVVLSGDTHSYNTWWRDGYWELNSGTLDEAPQWARLVELRRTPAGRLVLAARALRLRALPRDLPEWSEIRLEQELAQCRGLARLPVPRFYDERRGEDRIGRYADEDPRYLMRSALCGHYGAEKDRRHNQRIRQHRQPISEAWRESNVLLDITTK